MLAFVLTRSSSCCVSALEVLRMLLRASLFSTSNGSRIPEIGQELTEQVSGR
jgi:hypothetical protein